MLIGSFALLVIARGEDRIIAARYASPLVLGIGDREFFAASDMTPVIDYTERAIFLEDGDIASISLEKLRYSMKENQYIDLWSWLTGPKKIPKKVDLHILCSRKSTSSPRHFIILSDRYPMKHFLHP